MVGTVVALMLSVLVAVALLRLVMVPELDKLITPAALLVMPEMVPEPLRFSVPVLVKLAKAVEIAPAFVMVTVPALARVVIDDDPPKFKVPVALLVKLPVNDASDKAVDTVNVPGDVPPAEGNLNKFIIEKIKGYFVKHDFRNCIDVHFRYFGRAVSFPFNVPDQHIDNLIFENCTFANIGYIYSQRELKL